MKRTALFCGYFWWNLACYDRNNNYRICGRPLTQYPGGPVDKPVKAAAKRLGVSEDQVLLAWTKTKGAVVLSYVEGT